MHSLVASSCCAQSMLMLCSPAALSQQPTPHFCMQRYLFMKTIYHDDTPGETRSGASITLCCMTAVAAVGGVLACQPWTHACVHACRRVPAAVLQGRRCQHGGALHQEALHHGRRRREYEPPQRRPQGQNHTESIHLQRVMCIGCGVCSRMHYATAERC